MKVLSPLLIAPPFSLVQQVSAVAEVDGTGIVLAVGVAYATMTGTVSGTCVVIGVGTFVRHGFLPEPHALSPLTGIY